METIRMEDPDLQIEIGTEVEELEGIVAPWWLFYRGGW